MRKKIINKVACFAAIIFILCTTCTACGKTYQEVTGQKDNTEYSLCGNYFTLITEWDDSGAIYRIVYAKDTKVKYFIAKSYQFLYSLFHRRLIFPGVIWKHIAIVRIWEA